MSFTHTFTKNWSNGGAPINKSIEVVAGSEINLDESVPGPSTDLAISCGIDITALKSIFILSDINMTLKTNNSGSPDDTIDLIAGKPFIWDASDGYFANPFTQDIVTFYATIIGTTAATLKLRALVDPTP